MKGDFNRSDQYYRVHDGAYVGPFTYMAELLSRQGHSTGYPKDPYAQSNYIREKGSIALGNLGYSERAFFYPDTERTDAWSGPILFEDMLSPEWEAYIPPSTKDRALVTATNRANEAVGSQSINLGVAFGELNETITLLADSAARIAKTAAMVKRGNFIGASRALGLTSVPKGLRNSRRGRSQQGDSLILADNFLKFQFGYKPIVDDMADAMKTCYDGFQKKDAIVRVTGSKDFYGQYHGPYKEVTWGAFVPQFFRYRLSTFYSGSAKVVYFIRVANPAVAGLNQLGLGNPIATAYQLVPFSFVLDWFVNIGQNLNALSNWAGKDFVAGCSSISEHMDGTIFVTDSSSKGWTNDKDYASGSRYYSHFGRRTYDRYTRSVLSGPVPTRVQFSMPSKLGQYASSVALLSRLFK